MSSNDQEPHCKHYVTRKKRFCKMTLRAGDEYCGEHQPKSSEGNSDRDRIPCPLDPKHTCYANKLKAHLKKCNAQPSAPVPYIEKNINAGESYELEIKSRLLSKVAIDKMQEVVSKVNKVHCDVMKHSIKEQIVYHSILRNDLAKHEFGNSAKKHLAQNASILNILQDNGLFQPDTCYVEFGAGKGKLSFWVSKTLENMNISTSSVLLVERASHRHKCDNKLDKTTGKVTRIRADIADLILGKVEAITNAKHVVGLTKHLCGDATDLALRCLENCRRAGKDIAGVLMTFCCHHRCHWASYTGKAFFERVGLGQSDFDVMCGMVSWAVCGTGQSREKRQNPETFVEPNTRDIELGLTRDQKEEIGRRCKDLLNWGRKVYLEENGFKADLLYYVKRDVSLENVCVVGVKENKVF